MVKKAKDLKRPETSMAYSSLFTGAVREPQMLTELKKEILSANKKDMAATIDKVAAAFDSYWNDKEFVTYDESQKTRLIQALKNENYIGEGEDREVVFDIRPYSYQQEILDKLDAERKILGYTRNLVVAATGCGKTVMSIPIFWSYRYG